MNKPDPLRKVWSILSIPLSALGLLSLSDQLLSFKEDTQKLINSYKAIVYPIYAFLFSWLWFEIPTWIYDYITFGLLFASSHKKAFGFIYAESKFGILLKNIVSVISAVIFWPYLLYLTLHKINIYDKDGVVKHDPNDPNKFVYKYNYRDEEILVLKYIMVTLILATVIVIINYTYF